MLATATHAPHRRDEAEAEKGGQLMKQFGEACSETFQAQCGMEVVDNVFHYESVYIS